MIQKRSYLSQFIIYTLIATSVLSIFSGVFNRRDTLFKLGSRKITQSQLLKYAGTQSSSIDKNEFRIVFHDLLINILWNNYFEKNNVAIPREAIYEYAKNTYKTPEDLNKESIRSGTTKDHMLIKLANNLFYNLIIEFLLRNVYLTKEALNNTAENVFSQKKAYYKYISNTDYFDIHTFQEMPRATKLSLLKDEPQDNKMFSGFRETGYVSYTTHFQNNSSCKICQSSFKIKCPLCSTNICLCQKCFKKPDQLTRDVAAAVLLTSVGQTRVYQTQDSCLNIVVYVDHIITNEINEDTLQRLKSRSERIYKQCVRNIILNGVSQGV